MVFSLAGLNFGILRLDSRVYTSYNYYRVLKLLSILRPYYETDYILLSIVAGFGGLPVLHAMAGRTGAEVQMSRTTEILSVSLSRKELENISKLAKRERQTRSQLVREAIRRYQLMQNWQYLQSVGEKIATQLGIETEADVERVAG